ncbi:neutral zinc metallopeptidase [Flectobacillus roseus]|uniref:neutral zinc metallopeptidase n=1 Tax=Flectobacillus roseus TaxID=502259 RepID=UPI0024B63B1C|nr:neutral zinc metallopeptidase [Flectobacillus roseus]MDI9872245.1 neutral zinc metallopeptidase [Flectobacillus roseus]
MGIQNFWIQKFQQKQLTFNPPTVNTYSIQNPVNSTCGVQKNPNFIYCFLNNNIYLSEDLYKSMAKEFDLPSIEFAIAHEYGHAVQKQLDKIQSTSLTREYQADCLAGVYMSRYNEKSIIDKSVYSFLYKYTEHSTSFSSLFDPESHGDSESRFKAFRKGFEVKSVNECFNSYDLDGAVSGLINGLSELITGNYKNDNFDLVGIWIVDQNKSKVTFTKQNIIFIEQSDGKLFKGSYKIEGNQLFAKFTDNIKTVEQYYTINSSSENLIDYTLNKYRTINNQGYVINQKDVSINYTARR